MRYMLLMIPKGYESADAGAQPDPAQVAAMMRYNESLQRAGVLLAIDSLHPPASGARVHFTAGRARVVDGPFAEAKEVLGGYWLIQAQSREEAIAWATRCPAGDDEVIEVRQVHEFGDFSPEVQAVAGDYFERVGKR